MSSENFAALATLSSTNDALRDGIETLISKERHLAELSLMLLLEGGGAPSSTPPPFPGASSPFLPPPPTSPATAAPPHPFSGPPLRVTRDAATGSFSTGCAGEAEGGVGGATPPSPWLHSSQDPLRIPSHALAARPSLPSRLLRPACGRAELSGEEAALLAGLAPLGAGAPVGLDLRGLHLGEGGASAMEAAARALNAAAAGGGAGGAQLKALDVRDCSLTAGGVAGLLTSLPLLPKLAALCVEGSDCGGRGGVGAIIEAAAAMGCLAHLGVSVNDAPPLPFSTVEEPYPPGAGAAAHPAPGAVKGKAPAKAAAAAAPAKGKGAAVAGGAHAAAALFSPQGTSAHVMAALRRPTAPYVHSLSFAGSTLGRDTLKCVLSSWAPHPAPPPAAVSTAAHPAPAGAAHHAAAAAPGAKPAAASAKPAAAAKADVKKGAVAAKGGKGGVGSASAASTALLAALPPPLQSSSPSPSLPAMWAPFPLKTLAWPWAPPTGF